VKSAERIFDLIEAVGQSPRGATFPELSGRLGIPKSSLHGLLEVATARGYLEQEAGSRRYTLGIRAWEAGQAYARHHDIVAHAQAVMRDFVAEVNETVQLARLDGRENVYIAKVDSTHALRLQSDVGGRLLAHATGLGKTLLAELPDGEVRARFAGGLPRMTANTLTTPDALSAELDRTRERGFGIDNEEYTQGVFCLALPIRTGPGPAVLAISVTVPTTRARAGLLADALAGLARASLRIGARAAGTRPAGPIDRLSDREQAREAIEAVAASGRYRLSFPL
jgi:DNA-binding IclR family transcriptional regulator